jgi:peptide/nickel transport system substrate-binding protein
LSSSPTSAPPRPFGRRTRARLLAALAAGVLALTACGDSGDDAEQAASGPDTRAIKQGGQLTIAASIDSRQLDPWGGVVTALADAGRLTALYDVLVYLDGATGRVVPQTAESLTTADGGKVWTLKLRPGITFTDGTAYDAEAVRFTWGRIADPASRSTSAAAARGLVMDVTDPLTLRITLPTPNANFDRMVAAQIPFIASPTAYAKNPDQFGANPVGAGPFTLKEWVRGNHQVMVRNQNYWQKDKGLPKLDQLTFRTITDSNQRWNAFETGQLQIMTATDPATRARAEASGRRLTPLALHGGPALAFNTARPPFDDVRARRAVALALDPVDMNNVLYDGKATVARNGWWHQSGALTSKEVLSPGNDRAEAQRLLDELAAEGKPLNFTFMVATSPSTARLSEYVDSRLKNLKNIGMKIESLEATTFTQKFGVQRDFQMINYTTGALDPEPTLYNLLHSGLQSNWSGWSTPRADAALDAARASADPAVRQAQYRIVAEEMARELPVWAFAETTATVVQQNDVAGVVIANDGVLLPDRVGYAA